jgi:uncharacterized protein
LTKSQKIKLNPFDLESNIDLGFLECIRDLLENPEVRRLNAYIQHSTSTRLQHCLNVSYYGYKLARQLDYDFRSCARGGLLHDLYLYNTGQGISRRFVARHLRTHPQTALENAERLFELNEIEKDIILKHMWPVTPDLPKFPEAFLIANVDKYCASLEAFGRGLKREPSRPCRASFKLAAKAFDWVG